MMELVIFLTSFIVATYASEAERLLRKRLFDSEKYDPEVRPVKLETNAVNVTIDVALFQIIKLKEKDQTLEVSAWLRQTWMDDTMRWNHSDYQGITQLNVLPDKIWLPDVVLYNSVIEDNEIGGHLDKLNTRVMVHSSGKVQWTASAILKTHCNIKVKFFPFDSQHCELKFVSWTYAIPFLDIHTATNQVDTGNYQKNSEWELTSTKVIRREEKYKCCEHKFADISFHIDVARRSLFYLLNLVFPISVITMLTILSFLLPAESGERISLAVTLLLAVTVFMLIVADVTPATSEEIPLVSLYFIISMIDMVILMITVCYVNRLHHKEKSDGPMGAWTRRFILEKLSYIVRIQPRDPEETPMEHSAHSPKTYLMKKVTNSNGCTDNLSARETLSHEYDMLSLSDIVNKDTRELAKLMIRIEKKLSQRLDKLVEKVDDEDRDDLIKIEWRIVAMTVDRCLLLFFLLNFIVTLIGVFSLAPGYVK